MKIAFNPSTVEALITPPNNKDITFDLRGRNIFARGVKFCGTDTWRDIKINNVSIGSNILDLRNGSNTTLTNTNGVVTINSTWRPVVDNLTSDSTTSSLSAKQGKVLKALIDGKSDSGHNHDDRYLKLTGGIMQLGEGLKFHADENYFGTYADARIISLLDNNDTVCDGGLIIDERATLDGKEYVTELLRIRDSEFKWKGSNILHSGNTYVNNNKGYIYGNEITLVNNADTVDGYHASSLVKFYLSPMTSNAPADSAKNWFVNTMPSASGAIVYNVPGSEKTIIVGKSSSGAYGHMLQLNYDDNYLRILRYVYGSWKSTDWEKISAGYADSAGSVAWNNVTGKPSSYIPSAHTHAWNSLTHSSTTENQAILTNGKVNGWKLYTLNISRWDNAANNAHSHSNKSVLDGITYALVNNWNTAFTFVNTITGTDTDKVINKWDEIVNFLAGIDSNNKLNTLLNSKLSILLLSTKDILTTKTNNALFWVNTIGTASSITTGPFTDHPYALLSVTNYNYNAENSKFFYRSRLAFSSAGDIKVASCHHENEYKLDETWYNVLTSKNSGISGSTIKLNGTSITVYSSDTADGRYVKKSGDTMSGVLTIDTTNFGALTIKRNDDDNGASIQFRGKSSVYGYIGLNNSTKDKQFLRWGSDTSKTYTILDTSSTYVSNGKGIINGTTITQVDNATNSGNADTVDGVHVIWDGSITKTNWLAAWENWTTIRCISPSKVTVGNADKVDGYHVTSGNNKPWGTIPAITTNGLMDIGKQLEFHYDNTTGSDYSTVLMCTGNYSNIIDLPSMSGTLALTSQIPNVTNYYWANIKISDTSNSNTAPIFGSAIINTRLSIAPSTLTKTSPTSLQLVINGPYLEDSVTPGLKDWPGIGFHMPGRTWGSLIFNGDITAINSDYNGYVNYYGAGFRKNGSSDSYVLLGGGGHKALSDFMSSTIKYALSDTIGGNALLAYKLYYPSSALKDLASIDNFHEARIFKYGLWLGNSEEIGSSFPGTSNGIILSGGWTSAKYGFQLAIDDDPNYFIALRQRGNGTWSTWKRIPMGDGTGASGTWGINITGNADTVDGYHANGLLTALSNSNNGVSITVGGTTKSITNISVNYASSAGNADTLDGLDSTKFLRQVVVPNNTENDFNTFSNMTLTGRVDPTTGASLKNAPWSGSGPAGGYGVLTYLFNGYDYGIQMAWELGSNRIYIRNKHWGGSGVGPVWRTSWDKLALTSDIPTSLKNPHALTISLNGTSQGPYDGSVAKNINITPGSIGAATNNHNHTYITATDKRDSFHGQILSGIGLTLSLMNGTRVGINSDYCDAIIFDSWIGPTAGESNALMFAKGNTNVYHTQVPYKSTTSWGTPIKFWDSNNLKNVSQLTNDSGYITSSGSCAYATSAGFANGIANKGTLDSQEKIDNFITANRFEYATFKTAESNNVGFVSNDGMILSIPFTSTSYGAQMAFDDVHAATVKVRCKNQSWGNWYTLLHSGNYNNYAPSKTGTGASGTWGINISGNAATATSAGNADTTDGVHLEWNGVLAYNECSYLAGWTNDGKKIKAVNKSLFATSGHTHDDRYAFSNVVYYNINSGGFEKNTPFWFKFCTLPERNGGGEFYTIIIEATNGSDAPQVTVVDLVRSYNNDSIRGWNLVLRTSHCYYNGKGNVALITIDESNNIWFYYDSTWNLNLRLKVSIQSTISNITILTQNLAKATITTTTPTAAYGGNISIKKVPTAIYSTRGIIDVPTIYENGISLSSKYLGILANAASATKLQTPRTIWGQSFDGTNNINGTFYFTNGDATMKIYDVASTNSSYGNERVAIQTSFDGLDPLTSSYPSTYPDRSALLLLPRGGNIGIGTTSPSYKLHVAGDIYTTTGFKKNGSSDSYVLLGGGGHKALSDFSISGHTHSSITIPVCSSLDENSDIFRVEYAVGSNSVATKPSGVDAFGVIRLRTALGWYGQIMMSANTAPGIYYRNADGLSSSVGWKKILDSSNFNSYSPKLDGTGARGTWDINITGNATKVIVNLNTTNDTNYPLVWSNLNNSNNATENQLYKSWSDLYYNPKNKRLTVGGSVVASSFIKSGGTSLQLLRADGGIAAFNWSGQSGLPSWLWGGNNEHSYYVYNPSNFRVAYATSAGSADTLDGVHLNGIFTAFGNNAHNITATIGGVTKSFLVNWAADSDKLDGYHENSFLRYRETTSIDLENTLWDLIGIKLYNGALPDNLTNVYNYGSVISLPCTSTRFEIYASELASLGNGLYYRSGWRDTKRPWLKFIDSSNIGNQSVNYANSAGNADKLDGIHANGLLTALSNSNNGISITVGGTTKSISNISVNYAASAGSANSALQATNLTPENTPHYFRDPSNSSCRGGMYWGSAGNESMSFVAVNGGTRFQFVGGSDIANWTSSTWQSVTPYLTIYSSGIVTPGSVTATNGFIKSGSSDSYVLLGGGGHKLESSLRVAYASSAGSVAWDNVTGKPTMPSNITATEALIVTISGSTVTVNANLDAYKTPGEFNIFGTSNGDYAKMYVQSGIGDAFNGTRVITQTIKVTISHNTYAEICDVTRLYKSNAWSKWTIMYLGND